VLIKAVRCRWQKVTHIVGKEEPRAGWIGSDHPILGKAKEVADLVATTDGMIYHFYFDGKIPNGKTGIAQAVGHKPLSAVEYKSASAR